MVTTNDPKRETRNEVISKQILLFLKVLIESGASIFTRDKQGKNALGYALEVNEKTIQDEQVFDLVLSGMLREESEANALKQLHNLLRKYQKLHLKKSITCLLNRIPTLKARKGDKINHII